MQPSDHARGVDLVDHRLEADSPSGVAPRGNLPVAVARSVEVELGDAEALREADVVAHSLLRHASAAEEVRPAVDRRVERPGAANGGACELGRRGYGLLQDRTHLAPRGAHQRDLGAGEPKPRVARGSRRPDHAGEAPHARLEIHRQRARTKGLLGQALEREGYAEERQRLHAFAPDRLHLEHEEVPLRRHLDDRAHIRAAERHVQLAIGVGDRGGAVVLSLLADLRETRLGAVVRARASVHEVEIVSIRGDDVPRVVVHEGDVAPAFCGGDFAEHEDREEAAGD